MSETPWFWRLRSRWSYQIVPASAAGWIATVVYCVVFGGAAVLAAVSPSLRVLWFTMMGMSLAIYLIVAVRMSAPADKR